MISKNFIKAIQAQLFKVQQNIPKVDEEMSDTSTNPVQNMVVKKYIDETVSPSEGGSCNCTQYTDTEIEEAVANILGRAN